ncbi:branched-chain amino acid ABC transporter permease [Bosea sp. (in: a-proteobacteria)]|uniref:branched-chain amino acid ABC transporter permease n=1 Tax=Bosea sp. (in: a-proteobacteria) TaxID=1871050 RepID=UPI0026042063|nr:branched-chain amino acid ABC transporter permease [Bosea sp. (in: a-proteobacteria)]MCO5089562.1 branched-chain amino acid ABC transporter permease [Bosea sp. (in: a-proteobacteria)]
MRSSILRALAIAAIAVVIGFLPGLLGVSLFFYDTLVVIMIFSVMAYGMDIVLSDLGEVSLAHTTFFAAGSYTAGMLATGYGWNGWETLLASLAVGGLFAAVLGYVTLHLREFAFSLVTYAANIVCFTIAYNWSALGASEGIIGIPPLELPLPGIALTAVNSRDFWPFAYTLLLLVLFFVHRFRASRLGKAALMVHMNPQLATASGIDGSRVRLMVLILSAPLTAAGGWLYAYQRAYVGPDLFQTYFLVLMLTAVVIFGRRILLGPLLGTTFLLVQKNYFSLGAYGDKIVLGVILLLVLCTFPGGVTGLFSSRPGRAVTRFFGSSRRDAAAQGH